MTDFDSEYPVGFDYSSGPASLFATAARENPTTCVWKQDEGFYDDISWDTACGEKFEFYDGTPEDNAFNFCPFCGQHLKETP